MKNQIDDVGFSFPTVWVCQCWKDAHFSLRIVFKLRNKYSLNDIIFLKKAWNEFYNSISKTRACIDSEAWYDIMDNYIQRLLIFSLNFNDCVNDMKIFLKN